MITGNMSEELPPLNPAPAMTLDQFHPNELAVSVLACQNYAKLYGAECVRLERERCAKVCDELYARGFMGAAYYDAGPGIGALECAAAIRKKETPAGVTEAHTDHPMRHFDRTCPACVAAIRKGETP